MFELISFMQQDIQKHLDSPAMICHQKVFNKIREKSQITNIENAYLSVHSINGNRKNFAIPNNYRWLISKPYKKLICLNMDFENLIERFNEPDTFFYLDPPYLIEQDYKCKFTKDDFIRLKKTIYNIKGFWLMNHTKNEFIESVFGHPRFWKEYINTSAIDGSRSSRTEGFWMNF